jgi:hypothetical protein
LTRNLFENKRYSQLLYIGEIDGYKAYTFTCDPNRYESDSTTPNYNYFKSILSGLQFHVDDLEYLSYVIDSYAGIEGVSESYSKKDLIDMLK